VPLVSRYHDDDDDRQREADSDHLRLLSIFYYVFSALMALCGTFPVIHLVIGLAILGGGMPGPPQKQGQVQPPPFPGLFLGWIFVIVASVAIVFAWTLSICCMVVARSLRRRRRYLFCLIIAGVACLQQPFGLALGIFTIIVLMRPSVKATFERNRSIEPRAELDPHDTYRDERWSD